MKKREQKWAILLLPLAILLLIIFTTAVDRMDEGRGAEGKLRLEESLRRAAVACYAAEGSYPPNLAYMQEHYRLQYDTAQYKVVYEAFASNLMPDITVLEREDEDE